MSIIQDVKQKSGAQDSKEGKSLIHRVREIIAKTQLPSSETSPPSLSDDDKSDIKLFYKTLLGSTDSVVSYNKFNFANSAGVGNVDNVYSSTAFGICYIPQTSTVLPATNLYRLGNIVKLKYSKIRIALSNNTPNVTWSSNILDMGVRIIVGYDKAPLSGTPEFGTPSNIADDDAYAMTPVAGYVPNDYITTAPRNYASAGRYNIKYDKVHHFAKIAGGDGTAAGRVNVYGSEVVELHIDWDNLHQQYYDVGATNVLLNNPIMFIMCNYNAGVATPRVNWTSMTYFQDVTDK